MTFTSSPLPVCPKGFPAWKEVMATSMVTVGNAKHKTLFLDFYEILFNLMLLVSFDFHLISLGWGMIDEQHTAVKLQETQVKILF